MGGTDVRRAAGRDPEWPATEGRSVLLTEGVLPKFLRYVRIDTASDPAGPAVPTTPGQWDLSRLLAAECVEMGMEAAVDPHGIVLASLPPPVGPAARAPTVGFLAHVDTSPAASGRDVRPIVHRGYRGGTIRLPGGPELSPAMQPLLQTVIGHDLVTSDGTTLLGADDKAGVAVIMAAAARWLAEPAATRAPVRIAFTTDEETGRGIEFLDIDRFGADIAYTLDGGPIGEISAENFHAENVRVVVGGRSAHTGTARGQMINAVSAAANLVGMLPPEMRPETTLGGEGFVHFDRVAGTVERVELTVLLRDFDAGGLERKRSWLRCACAALEAGSPGLSVTTTTVGGYRNMRQAVERVPQTVLLAERAMREAGVEPRPTRIRGGTDGARLSERGLPTPNLFAGGVDFHSLSEWASVQWMERAVDTVAALAGLWAAERAAR